MTFAQQLSTRLNDSPWGQRWQRLEPRERRSLGLLAGFILVTLCYLLLWQPAQQRVGEARAYFQQERELYTYLQQNTELARQMSRSEVVILAPEQLQGLVTQSAQQHGLMIESYDMGSEGEFQVSLPGTSYAALLRWFDALQAAGAGVAEVSLSRVGEGLVDARVTFRAGG